MANELAAANVTRTYSLGATSIAIFTFTLFFLFPRYAQGEIIASMFQATLLAMGVATFCFAFAAFYYYGASVGGRTQDSGRADRFWLLGYTMLLLAPSLVLFSIRLFPVGYVWFAFWLGYVIFALRHFRGLTRP